MAAFTHFSRIITNNLKSDLRIQINSNCSVCLRLLSYTTREYDGNPDPGPVFIKKEVQSLLKSLTRVDLTKVYRKRKLGDKKLDQPVYKFMTNEQLQETLDKVKEKVDHILQIPPVVAVRKPIDKIYSKDPALQGLETSRFIFTDISFGVRDSERYIVVRETDGTLKAADWDTRARLNQLYFPMKHRQLKEPKMFQDEYLESLLNRHEYEFILDRACVQFEPNDPKFQKIVTITYQHLNDNNQFETLRSTRHFGGLAFFLAWNKMIDNLLLDLIDSDHVDEANSLIELYSQIHKEQFHSDGHLKSVEAYIKKFANNKAVLELAIQGYKGRLKEKQELEQGIKRAHGLN